MLIWQAMLEDAPLGHDNGLRRFQHAACDEGSADIDSPSRDVAVLASMEIDARAGLAVIGKALTLRVRASFGDGLIEQGSVCGREFSRAIVAEIFRG